MVRSDSDDESATPVEVEFALSHVIERARISSPLAIRRLNGIENTLAALAVEWRPWRPIIAAQELRMADATSTALIAWVTAEEEALPGVAVRLAAYSSSDLIDATVPAGWVRILLPNTDGSLGT